VALLVIGGVPLMDATVPDGGVACQQACRPVMFDGVVVVVPRIAGAGDLVGCGALSPQWK
jgi:hypothetical protein